jgi:uncharacterized OsmC-like protein
LGGALEARGIPAGGGRLRAEAIGEIELDGRVLVLKRIFVRYRLRVAAGADRSAIDRVMGFHADRCPVARSIQDAISVTTDIDVIEE